MPDNNTELWTKEAEMYLDICADFLARMILKHGPEFLEDIKNKKQLDSKE